MLPDGCMDLLWTEGRLLVAGPDTRPYAGRESACRPARRPPCSAFPPTNSATGASTSPTCGPPPGCAG